MRILLDSNIFIDCALKRLNPNILLDSDPHYATITSIEILGLGLRVKNPAPS